MQIEQSVNSGLQRVWPGFRAVAALAVSLIFTAALPASAATLDRIKETGHIKFGYLADARPFTYTSDGDKADGYSAALCQQIANSVKTQLGLTALEVDWVPVALDSRVTQVQQGNVDLLCAPMTPTLSRRQEVAFSIPVFPSGVRAVMRKDAAVALRDALGENPNPKPLWRGSPAAKVLDKKSFAVVSGTTTERWLAGNLASLQIDAKIVPVADYRTGLKQLLDRKVDVFFGDRTVVLGAMSSADRENLEIFNRMLTHEPVALALARGDEDFRLLVDRTLSESYASAKFGELYAKWFGEFNDKSREFFLWSTVTP